MVFWLVLKLEISYRVIISRMILVSFRRRLYFCMVKYLSFLDSAFAFRYFLMEMARPHCDTPLVLSCIVKIMWCPMYDHYVLVLVFASFLFSLAIWHTKLQQWQYGLSKYSYSCHMDWISVYLVASIRGPLATMVSTFASSFLKKMKAGSKWEGKRMLD
jgi:hypothetical protein